MKRVLTSLCLISCVTLALAAYGDAQLLNVQVAILKDNRLRFFGQTPGSSSREGDMTVTFKLSGPQIQQIHYYGQWKIIEATDEKGNDLRDLSSHAVSDNNSWQTFYANPGTVELGLMTPERQATKIMRLRGEFRTIEGGQPRAIIFPKLKSLVGRPLSHPLLHTLGLNISVLPLKNLNKGKAPAPNAFRLQVQGKQQLFDATKGDYGVEVIDKAGRNLTDYIEAGKVWYLKRAPDNTMRLRLHLIIKPQAKTVSFDFHDIMLP